jgi:hypothetical protein
MQQRQAFYDEPVKEEIKQSEIFNDLTSKVLKQNGIEKT